MFERGWIAVVLLMVAENGSEPMPRMEVQIAAQEGIDPRDQTRWQGTAEIAVRTGGGDARVVVELRDRDGGTLTLEGEGHSEPHPGDGTMVIEGHFELARTGALNTVEPVRVVYHPERNELDVHAGDVVLHFSDAKLSPRTIW